MGYFDTILTQKINQYPESNCGIEIHKWLINPQKSDLPGPPYHLVSQSETTALTGSTTKMIGGSGGVYRSVPKICTFKKKTDHFKSTRSHGVLGEENSL